MTDKFDPRVANMKLPAGKAKSESKPVKKPAGEPGLKSSFLTPPASGQVPTKVSNPRLPQLKAKVLPSTLSQRPSVSAAGPKATLQAKGAKQADRAKQTEVLDKPAKVDSEKRVEMDALAAELESLFESMQGDSAQAAYAAAFAASSQNLGLAAVEAKRRGL